MRALQFLKQHLLAVILLLVVLAALITGISVGNYLSNPKRVVDQYFSALKKGNWEKAYSQLYVKESDFVNYDAYEAMMEREAKLYTGIGSYRIHEDGASSGTRKSKGSKDDAERLMRTYTVDYVTDRSTSNEMSVEVVKLSKKKFLFFPEYQISASSMLGSFTGVRRATPKSRWTVFPLTATRRMPMRRTTTSTTALTPSSPGYTRCRHLRS